MNELTRDEWVPMISKEFMDCRDMNSLILKLHLIVQLRRFEGVIPYCVDAARYRAKQLDPHPGVTTVVDGEGVLCAAGFACQRIESTPTAVIDMLKKIWKATLPTHFIVAFDDDRRFKREKFPEFKANKKPNPRKDAIDAIKPEVIKQVRDKNIQVEVVEGYEADDVLATVATQCQLIGHECVMATEDKDCWQALGPNTTIYSRSKDAFYGVQWLKTEHKITPAQVVDWLIFEGKNGVPKPEGIAGGIASNLLEAYGTFLQILESDKLTPAKRKAMEAVDYWKLREIHTLNRELAIGRAKYTPHDAVRPGHNQERAEEQVQPA